jgi:hypothetical protein
MTTDHKLLSGWIIIDSYCATRVLLGTDPAVVANRVAFIEKTPRVRVSCPGDALTCEHREPYQSVQGTWWIDGHVGSSGDDGEDYEAGGGYGFHPGSRAWCDAALRELGWVLTDTPDYPEHRKLKTAREELGIQSVGEFLEWLGEKEVRLCRWQDHVPGVPCPERGNRIPDGGCPHCGAESYHHGDSLHEWIDEAVPAGYYTIRENPDQLLHRYSGVDRDAIEREKNNMLALIRQDLGQG